MLYNDDTSKLNQEQINEVLGDLRKIWSYCNTSGERFAILLSMTEIEKSIPKYVIKESWNPNRCPTCWEDLGGECYDGYYENPHYEVCPNCRQKLKYNDYDD